MATAATIQHDEPLVPVGGMAKTKAAEQKLSAVRKELGEVGETLSRYRSALDPNVAQHQHPSMEAVWDARLNIAETERKFAQLSRDEAAAQRVAAQAREADVTAAHARFTALKRAQLPALITKVREAAAAMVQYQQLETREIEEVGVTDRTHFAPLGVNDADLSLVDEWTARLRAAGLLD